MALDASKVRVGVSGALYLDSTGNTAVPTDATKALPASFVDLGYISEDGVTETRDRSSDKIKAWQNAAVVREVVTEASLQYQFTLIETKRETIEFFYGASVDDKGRILISPGATPESKPMVLDVIDGAERIRCYIPAPIAIEFGDQVYASGEPIGYEVTISATPSTKVTDTNGEPVSAVKWYSALAAGADTKG